MDSFWLEGIVLHCFTSCNEDEVVCNYAISCFGMAIFLILSLNNMHYTLPLVYYWVLKLYKEMGFFFKETQH